MAEAEAHVVDPQPQQEHQDEEQPKTQSPSETEPQNEASIQSQTQPQPVDAPLSISDTTIPPAAAVVAASTPIASANTSNTARDKQISLLNAKIAATSAQVTDIEGKTTELTSKLSNPDANATVQRHIKLLHDFNEIRDIGLGLIGMVAEGRQQRVQDVMGEFGVSAKD